MKLGADFSRGVCTADHRHTVLMTHPLTLRESTLATLVAASGTGQDRPLSAPFARSGIRGVIPNPAVYFQA